MAIKINNNSYNKFYLDGDEVSKIYLNSNLVYTAGSGGGDEPAAWEEWEEEFLTFTALEATDIGLLASGMTAPNCYYRKATDTGYTQMTTATTISLSAGEQVKFYGSNAYWSTDMETWTKFTSTGKFNISGSLKTLLASGSTAPIRQQYCFRRLFAETHVVDASELELPAYSHNRYMYHGMMQQCPYLQKLPVMPRPGDSYEYAYFCNQCPSLQSATLPTGKYRQYFAYQGMFQDCSGLTAVTIPAEVITIASAVTLLFQRCTALQTIIFSNLTTLSVDLASDWFDGAENTVGTAYVPANRTYADSRLNLPSGWSVQDLPT